MQKQPAIFPIFIVLHLKKMNIMASTSEVGYAKQLAEFEDFTEKLIQ